MSWVRVPPLQPAPHFQYHCSVPFHMERYCCFKPYHDRAGRRSGGQGMGGGYPSLMYEGYPPPIPCRLTFCLLYRDMVQNSNTAPYGTVRCNDIEIGCWLQRRDSNPCIPAYEAGEIAASQLCHKCRADRWRDQHSQIRISLPEPPQIK